MDVASTTLSAASGNSFILQFSLDPSKDADNTANDIEDAVRDWLSQQELDFALERDDVVISVCVMGVLSLATDRGRKGVQKARIKPCGSRNGGRLLLSSRDALVLPTFGT